MRPLAPRPRLDGSRGRFHDCAHENRAAKIRADGGHPAPGLFDRRLSDGREPRREGICSGSSRRSAAFSRSTGSSSRAASPRPCARDRFQVVADRAFETVVRACAEREKTWINDEIVRLYGELFAGRSRPFGRGLRGRRAGRRPLWREPARRLLRRKHVPSRPRRLEGRARPSVRAAQDRRLRDCSTRNSSPSILASLGAVEISREAFRRRLAEALGDRRGFRRLAGRGADERAPRRLSALKATAARKLRRAIHRGGRVVPP